MNFYAALAVSLFGPATLLCSVALFPKRWFSPRNDAERRVLQEFGKYDAGLHGTMEG